MNIELWISIFSGVFGVAGFYLSYVQYTRLQKLKESQEKILIETKTMLNTIRFDLVDFAATADKGVQSAKKSSHYLETELFRIMRKKAQIQVAKIEQTDKKLTNWSELKFPSDYKKKSNKHIKNRPAKSLP